MLFNSRRNKIPLIKNSISNLRRRCRSTTNQRTGSYFSVQPDTFLLFDVAIYEHHPLRRMTTIVETLSKKVIPTAFTLLSHKNFPISLLHLPSPSIHPSSSSSKSKLPPAILLTPATGVPAKFYLPFANYLNQTYASPCLIVDYRFSGKSFPAGIRMNDRKGKLDSLLSDQAKEVTYFDWARDEELALQWLVDEYAEEREIVVVCNSVGGHLLPQVKPSLTDRVARALFLGVFAPYHGLAPASEEPQKRARWIDLVAEVSPLPCSLLTSFLLTLQLVIVDEIKRIFPRKDSWIWQ